MKIAIARLAYDGWHHASIGDWLARTCHEIVTDERCTGLDSFFVQGISPIDSARNMAVLRAQKSNCTHLMMIDSDMVLKAGDGFWRAAIEHLREPGVVCCPALNAKRLVCVNRDDGALYQTSECEDKNGIERVRASGISCCMIDMLVFDMLKKPYFSIGYDEDGMAHKYEDVSFTSQVPTYVSWNHWIGHEKAVIFG